MFSFCGPDSKMPHWMRHVPGCEHASAAEKHSWVSGGIISLASSFILQSCHKIMELSEVSWLLCPSNHLCFLTGCVTLLKEATEARLYRYHERVHMVRNNAKVGGTCQRSSPLGCQEPNFPTITLPNECTLELKQLIERFE